MSVPRPHSEGVMLPSGGNLHSQPRERMLVVVSGEFSYNTFSVYKIHCVKNYIKSIEINTFIVILSCWQNKHNNHVSTRF